MISGRVANDGSQATIKLNVRGPTGRTLHVEAIIDTGFSGALSLYPQEVDDLRLPWVGHIIATLADESEHLADGYSAEVMWDSTPREITVTAISGGPLVGMSLMKNYRLTIDVLPNGLLTLKPLDSTNN